MPAWRRRLVVASANFAGFVVRMLGFRTFVNGYENVAKAKQLGAVRGLRFQQTCFSWLFLFRRQFC